MARRRSAQQTTAHLADAEAAILEQWGPLPDGQVRCTGCGRPILPAPVQVCGKCRKAMTQDEIRAMLPKSNGGDHLAVAIVRRGGSAQLVELNLPMSVIEEHTTKAHEPEFLPMVMPKLTEVAEAWWEGQRKKATGGEEG